MTGLKSERERQDERLNMHFTINTLYLITHTLSRARTNAFSSEDHREDILAFLNYASGVSKRCVAFLTGQHSPELFFSLGTQQEIADFFTTVALSREFRPIRTQTEAYVQFVTEQWERNYPASRQAIREMTGLHLQQDMTVLITHPSLKNGKYVGNNTIAWGHHEEWANYTTVYLWHEILHSYFDVGDMSHALIHLIADNELRIRLNEEPTYPPFTGHARLFPLMEQLFPHWRSYLMNREQEGCGDIRDFQMRMEAFLEKKLERSNQ